MKECFFCGETNEIVLDEHHLVPKSTKITTTTETVTLCTNCHRKLHYLLKPLLKQIKLEIVPELTLDQIMREDKTGRTHLKKLIIKVLRASDNNMLDRKGLYQNLQEFSKLEIASAITELLEQGTIYAPRKGFFKAT